MKNLVFVISTLVGLLSIMGVVIPLQNSAWGVVKLCNFPSSSGVCAGTDGGDVMSGDGQDNFITGCSGDDVLSGGGGNDQINGDGIIRSDEECPGGNFNGGGADRMYGGRGDDVILHGFNGSPGTVISSDGHRDLIDCGPGDDTAIINTSVDHDVAVNCERVIAG